MYKEFFGLEKLPFNLTPDPAFLYLPTKHAEALAGLVYAISERKGFVVLTGDAGTGKTTLLSAVLQRLPTEKVQSSVILNPTLNPSEFLEIVLLDFGISNVPASKAQRLWKLQEVLLQAYRNEGIAVLVIDEAHKLSLEVIEEIRLLGNFEFGADKFLQIVLLGQCELNDLLDRQDLRQFKQRIALRLYVDPLASADIEKYLAFRWKKAGGDSAMPFSVDAISAIGEYSHGIPRLINSLCDTALLMAYGELARLVGVRYIHDAAVNLCLTDNPRPAAVPLRPASPNAEAPSPGKLVPIEVPSHRMIENDDDSIPTLARYQTRANSSWLKRLAGKLGTH
jgi:general secretion pathway protein A